MTAADNGSDADILRVYHGQFGDYVIDRRDRREVQIYRGALMGCALCVAAATNLVLQDDPSPVLPIVSGLYAGFCLCLGVALWFIHIYLAALHRTLQGFWLVGCITSAIAAWGHPLALAQIAYAQPLWLLGIGFTFAALTGIFFKEAFCFNRLETKLLTVLVPFLLLGHLAGKFPPVWERVLLAAWAVLFLVFAVRKCFQAVDADIGDKSVFARLRSPQTVQFPL